MVFFKGGGRVTTSFTYNEIIIYIDIIEKTNLQIIYFINYFPPNTLKTNCGNCINPVKFNFTAQIPLPTPIFPQLWCGAELGWEETTWGPPTPGCRPESDCERGERGEPSPSVPLSLSRAVRGPGQARPPCDCESSVLRWQQISRSSFSRQLWNKISDHVEITGQHATRWVPPVAQLIKY